MIYENEDRDLTYFWNYLETSMRMDGKRMTNVATHFIYDYQKGRKMVNPFRLNSRLDVLFFLSILP